MKPDTIKSLLLLAAVGGVAYVGWRAFAKGAQAVTDVQKFFTDTWDKAAATVEQGAANVSSWVGNNITGPWQQGQDWANGVDQPKSTKYWLYNDLAYTGVDPTTKQPITLGEWYGNADARRYDYEQRQAGAAPAATSINGAAFGIYPKAGTFTNGTYATQADVRRVDQALGW